MSSRPAEGILVKRALLVAPEAALPAFKAADWARQSKNDGCARRIKNRRPRIVSGAIINAIFIKLFGQFKTLTTFIRAKKD